MNCHAKIVPGENCTWRCTQNCTARYNFGCEKCTDLAKSVPGSQKGPLAIKDVGLSVLLCSICAILKKKTRSLEITVVYSWCM